MVASLQLLLICDRTGILVRNHDGVERFEVKQGTNDIFSEDGAWSDDGFFFFLCFCNEEAENTFKLTTAKNLP